MPQQKSEPKKVRTFSQLMKVPAFRVYFIFSLLSIIVLIGLVYWAIPDDKDLRSSLRGKNAEIEDLENDLEQLRKLIALDGSVILTENHQKALEDYTQLLEESDEEYLDKLLHDRIQQMELLISERNENKDEADRKSYIINEQKQNINRLEAQIDSLDSVRIDRADSFTAQADSLKDVIRKKEKKLNQKERVQVITFEASSGATVHYLGEVENGKANGGGVGIWTTGSVYKGDWKENKRHGEGTIESPNGERYKGDWKEGVREGEGTYYWPSGERYEGEWENNQRNGRGTLYDRDSNIRFKGEWKDDKPVRD